VPTWRKNSIRFLPVVGGAGTARRGDLVVGVPASFAETAPGTHGNGHTGNATGDDSGEWRGAPGTDD
jgi:hypothetical protein